jgi:hypothetical protein
MKSYNYIIGMFFILMILCLTIALLHKSDVPIDNDQNRISDSLQAVIQQFAINYDSLKNDYKVWVVRTFDMEKHCLSDAQTIKNNPTTAVFAVNWAKRNFQWTHDWKHKKKKDN